MRYFIEFSYNGLPYFGYQIQPNQISVQEEIEKALSLLLKQKIKITAAGRTDTGVHAKKIFAHFDISELPEINITHRLNAFLPPSISIKNIFRVKESLHARFDAIYRTYEYFISLLKNPFLENTSWQIWKRNLNINLMNNACRILSEHQDFTSFSKLHTNTKTNFCKIYHASWEKEDHLLKFTISADRFLRNMVRAIVGTMVDIGLEKITIEQFNEIIISKDRNAAGSSAPAKGLFLVDVGYPKDFDSPNLP